jgi:Cysteine-rich secretory protein family
MCVCSGVRLQRCASVPICVCGDMRLRRGSRIVASSMTPWRNDRRQAQRGCRASADGVMMVRSAVRLRGAVVASLLAVVIALGLVAAQPSPAHAGETDTIYSLVNDARWSQGSSGLVRNPAMDAIAANWAAALAQAGTLSHNPNYSSQIPGGWVSAGENVAQGYYGGAVMHDGWMNSAGHRANILGDFTDIGIAYLEAGGTTWGVQVFAKYPGTDTPAAPAPAPAAAAPAPVVEQPAPAEAAPAPAPSPVPAVTPTPEPRTTPAPNNSSPETAGATADARSQTKTTAGGVESSDRASSVTDAASPPGGTSPLWAGLLGVVLVAGASIVSYRLRSRRREHRPAD